MNLISKSLLTAGIAALFSSSLATASTVTINASNSGWYSVAFGANGSVNNLFTGNTSGTNFRDWLGFDLSSVSGTITGASLELASYPLNSPNQSMTWWDVTTPYASLGTSSMAIYNDLGTGTVFSTGVQNPGVLNLFAINAAGLASLNAASSFWAVGGVNNSGNEAFGYTGGVGSGDYLKLILTVDGSSSLPDGGSSVALLGLALGGMAVARRTLNRA